MSNLITISNVRGFIDKEGTAQLNLEDVARGLGFTTVAISGKEYVRWNTVREYLGSFGFLQEVAKDEITQEQAKAELPEFIPENIFYLLSMKASNKTAVAFQMKVANEILPSIRKTGSYSIQQSLPQNYLEALEALVASEKEKQILLPKAQYFDDLVDRNLLTNFRDTAKELKIKEQVFINWLIEKNYIYRDLAKKLKPYAQHVPKLFEIKESKSDKWAGTQTLITPRGRETFRLLLSQGRELVKV